MEADFFSFIDIFIHMHINVLLIIFIQFLFQYSFSFHFPFYLGYMNTICLNQIKLRRLMIAYKLLNAFRRIPS